MTRGTVVGAGVETVVAPSCEVLTSAPDTPTWLDTWERERIGRRRRRQDRDDAIAARWLVRRLVGRVTGIAPQAVVVRQRCDRCGGPHGRPLLATGHRLCLSYAHASGWVAAAVGERRCGIDVEVVAALPEPDELMGALSEPERRWVRSQPDARAAFAALWVRKEALVKAGRLELVGAATVSVVAAGALRARVRGCELRRVPTGAGDAVVAAVAILAAVDDARRPIA